MKWFHISGRGAISFLSYISQYPSDSQNQQPLIIRIRLLCARTVIREDGCEPQASSFENGCAPENSAYTIVPRVTLSAHLFHLHVMIIGLSHL